MAKAFFNTEGYIVKISTDSDVANHNIEANNYIVKDISDADFNSIRQSLKHPSLVEDTVSYEDLTIIFLDSEKLSNYFSKTVIPLIDNFLEMNPGNAMWDELNTYKKVLETTDVSAITYPYNFSWEKYCTDNSITYYHPLQIP